MDRRDKREWRKTDTMPQSGKVGEVCQKWLVHEDEALAHRLQNEEISSHYHGNRSRNALIRQDLPQAKQEQMKEEEEAEQLRAMYRDMLRRQEQRDAELAAKLQRQVAVGRSVIPEEPLPPPPPPLSPEDEDVRGTYRHETAVGARAVEDSVDYDEDDDDVDADSESALGAVGGGGAAAAAAYYYPPPSPIRESDFPFLGSSSSSSSRQLMPRPQEPVGRQAQYFPAAEPPPPPPPQLPSRRCPRPPPFPLLAQPQAAVVAFDSNNKRKPFVLSSEEDLRSLAVADEDEGVFSPRSGASIREEEEEDEDDDVDDEDDEDEEDEERYVTGQSRFDFLSEEEEEEARRRQELEDEELAKRIQEEEIRDMSPVEILERDRVIAMEAQDREYARLLYEKEKARARRAARERRARKEGQQQRDERRERPMQVTPGDADPDPDPDRIDVMSDEESDRNPRRAAGERAVDVGSLDKAKNRAAPRRSSCSVDEEEFIGTSPICPQPLPIPRSTSPAPPYMPIQGQRRLHAFEKKSKKKDKGCAQQ